MKIAYSFVFFALALTLSMFSSESSASIPPQGWPRFTNTVQLGVDEFRGGGLKITAEDHRGGDFFFTLKEGGEQFDVKNGSYELTANFDENLKFVSGKVEIKGTFWDDELPAPPANHRINLYSADLGEADFSLFSGSNPSLGFRTLASSVGGWAAQFQKSDESIYISGFTPDPVTSPFAFLLSLVKGKATGTAVTTVPVPAAFWLLGSGLLAVFGARRRVTFSAA